MAAWRVLAPPTAIGHHLLAGEKKHPQFGWKKPPQGVFLPGGGRFSPQLGGLGVGGVFSARFWVVLSPLLGGGVVLGGFFLPFFGGGSPFWQLILKTPPPGFTGKGTALRQHAYTHHSPKICSLCVLRYNSGWSWLYLTLQGGGGIAHLFVNQKSQYQKTGRFMSICCAVHRTPLGRGGGLPHFHFRYGGSRGDAGSRKQK